MDFKFTTGLDNVRQVHTYSTIRHCELPKSASMLTIHISVVEHVLIQSVASFLPENKGRRCDRRDNGKKETEKLRMGRDFSAKDVMASFFLHSIFVLREIIEMLFFQLFPRTAKRAGRSSKNLGSPKILALTFSTC